MWHKIVFESFYKKPRVHCPFSNVSMIKVETLVSKLTDKTKDILNDET